MAALIRFGLICRRCTGKKCVDLSTDAEPVLLDCPECDGDSEGCEHCTFGKVRPDIDCPKEYCQEIAKVLPLIDKYYDHGLPPILGGVLDQSAWFINAAQTLKREEARLKAELDR